MSKIPNSPSAKAGLPPGTLVHIGEVAREKPRITIIDYSSADLAERVVTSIDEILPYKAKDSITWVNIDGLADVGLIEAIGEHFDIHPLVQEDILNTHQRPKFEEYEGYLYMVLKVLSMNDDGRSINYEQMSILVLGNMVFTFKESHDDIFSPLKRRIINSKGRLRSQGTDYLAYAIIDTVVDLYFSLQDSFDETIEFIESKLLDHPTRETLIMIQGMKSEVIYVRRAIAPVRELLNGILRSESPLISSDIHVYIGDAYDHVLRLAEAMDTYRDMITGLLDIYISSVSNHMNEIMKVLTVFASIFIPLTFIAGIYGMNFEFMPELKWKWAYPALWSVFVIVPIIFIYIFKKKKWL